MNQQDYDILLLSAQKLCKASDLLFEPMDVVHTACLLAASFEYAAIDEHLKRAYHELKDELRGFAEYHDSCNEKRKHIGQEKVCNTCNDLLPIERFQSRERRNGIITYANRCKLCEARRKNAWAKAKGYSSKERCAAGRKNLDDWYIIQTLRQANRFLVITDEDIAARREQIKQHRKKYKK